MLNIVWEWAGELLTGRTLLSSMGTVISLHLSLGEESGQETLPERDFPEHFSVCTCAWDPGGLSDRSTWSLVCLKTLGESHDLRC